MADREMPKYKSHKVVWALKIKEIVQTLCIDTSVPVDSGATITPVDEGYGPFEVSAGYMRRHNPQVGGYYVIYQDGHSSYSPAAAFEEGHTRVPMVSLQSREPSDRALEIAARCWTDTETKSATMDTELAKAFARRVDVLLNGVEDAWGLIVNSQAAHSPGCHSDRKKDWQLAMAAWREEFYHQLLDKENPLI